MHRKLPGLGAGRPFCEDDCCIWVGDPAQNFTILRRIAHHLLKSDTAMKPGIANKRLKVGWNVNDLGKLHGLKKRIFHTIAL